MGRSCLCPLDDTAFPATAYGDRQQAQRQDQQRQRLGQPERKERRRADKEQVIEVICGVHQAGNRTDPDMSYPPGRVRQRPEQTEAHGQLEDARIAEVVAIEGHKLDQGLEGVGLEEDDRRGAHEKQDIHRQNKLSKSSPKD